MFLYILGDETAQARARNPEGNQFNMKTISRKQAKEAIQTKGLEGALHLGKTGLTAKQRKFAEGIVLEGLTGADSYRQAYDTSAKPKRVGNAASTLKQHEGIKRAMDMLEAHKQAVASHSAESLRALCVSTLVDVATNSDRDAVRVAAVRVLGSVVGVDAYRETKRIETVKPSDEIKAQIMQQLKGMMLSTDDVETVDATELLNELTRANASESADDDILTSGEGTPPPCPEAAIEPHLHTLHTISLKQSAQNTDSPIPSEDPPSSFQIDNGEGDIISDDDAYFALYGKVPPCSDKGE
jgi:hypothetical protein